MKRNYAIGSDGCLVHVETPLVEGWEDIGADVKALLAYVEHPLRDDIKPGLRWIGSKMPADMLKRVLGTIRKFPSREVGFVLCYNADSREWHVQCPDQHGSGASVSFMDQRTPDGFMCIGTIHTHPGMDAFWSGTDRHDQAGRHGLHIVFGLDDGLAARCLCTMFTPHGSYNWDIDDVFEHVDRMQEYPPDDEWVGIIDKQSFVQQAVPWAEDCKPGHPDSGALTLPPDAWRGAWPAADRAMVSQAAAGDEFDEALDKASLYDQLMDGVFQGLEVQDVQKLLDEHASANLVVFDLDDVEAGAVCTSEEAFDNLAEALGNVADNALDCADGDYDSEVEGVLADAGFVHAASLKLLTYKAMEGASPDELRRRNVIKARAESFVKAYLKLFGRPSHA